LLDVIIPEVSALQQTARFFKEENRDFVEISFVGEKDTVIRKVQPEHMAKFRDAWNAFCDGQPVKQRQGTSLIDIPGLSDQLAQKYISANVHTAEEIAALSDMQCQTLGHGTLTFRTTARNMLDMRRQQKMEEDTRRISKAAESVQSLPAEMEAKYASKEDVEEIKGQMGQIMGLMQQLLEKKKPGRPKKED
jgi:hypothetical protein